MNWQDLFSYAAFQSSVVPFVASLVVAALLIPLRLSGVGAAVGWLAAIYVIGNFAFEPLTATRKLVVVSAAAGAIGLLADFAFTPTRRIEFLLAVVFGGASVWVFWSVLSQQPPARAVAFAAGSAALAVWLTAGLTALQSDAVRTAAAGLGLGLGVGTAAILGASALLGQYGLALGAACGAVLFLVMALGKRVSAGASLALPVAAATALLAAGAVLLADLSAWAAAALAAVPLAVRLPLPRAAATWLQAFVAGFYALIVAASACVMAYVLSRSG